MARERGRGFARCLQPTPGRHERCLRDPPNRFCPPGHRRGRAAPAKEKGEHPSVMRKSLFQGCSGGGSEDYESRWMLRVISYSSESLRDDPHAIKCCKHVATNMLQVTLILNPAKVQQMSPFRCTTTKKNTCENPGRYIEDCIAEGETQCSLIW